ncbi:zinc finger protein 501-like [Culicoides brevitarsis]|uniref:zinc finger protein 501-like n=1 Tax=Culicoides brevitarsis TaxID=469753 RepID=UPI00307BC5FF
MNVNFAIESTTKGTCTACLKGIEKSCDETGIWAKIYRDLLTTEVNRLPIDVEYHFCDVCQQELQKIDDFRKTCMTSITFLENLDFSLPDIDFSAFNEAKLVDEILEEKILIEDGLLEEVIFEPNLDFLPEERKRSPDNRTFCSICLINVPKITKHAVKVHSVLNEDNNLECTACSKMFACREKFVEHFGNFHREWSEPKACHICGSLFTKKPDYDRHLALHNKSKRQENRYKCTECDKFFSNTTLVKYHKIKDHEGGIQCRYCPIAFRQEDFDKYTEHLRKEEDRKHTRPSKQKHVCAFCGDEKSDSSSLYEHIRRYHNDDTFTCDICSKSFRSKFAFKHHYEAVHGERRHECSECGRRFKLKSGLKSHLLSHAPSEECKICQKKLSPRYMSHHLKLHSEKQSVFAVTCATKWNGNSV